MSGPVDLGQTYRYRHYIHDDDGDLAAATVTATVTLPDGTTAAATVSTPSLGVYDLSYTTSQPGLHNLLGSATGGVLASEVDKWEDVFTVERPGGMVIGVDEAADHLRVGQGALASTELREQLRGFCLAATSVVGLSLGRVLTRRTVTETLDGGRAMLTLRATPVASITTVLENGTAVDSGGYLLPLASIGGSLSGKLYRGGTTSRLPWGYGFQNVAVTYVAGLAAINTAEAHDALRIVRKVCLNTVQGMWQATQQSNDFGDDLGEAAAFIATGTLTPGERAAYDALRPVTGFA